MSAGAKREYVAREPEPGKPRYVMCHCPHKRNTGRVYLGWQSCVWCGHLIGKLGR